jgi:hypothetical protein
MQWVDSITPWPHFTPKEPGTHWTGGWLGPRAGLNPLCLRQGSNLNHLVIQISHLYSPIILDPVHININALIAGKQVVSWFWGWTNCKMCSTVTHTGKAGRWQGHDAICPSPLTHICCPPSVFMQDKHEYCQTWFISCSQFLLVSTRTVTMLQAAQPGFDSQQWQ